MAGLWSAGVLPTFVLGCRGFTGGMTQYKPTNLGLFVRDNKLGKVHQKEI